MTSNTSTSCSTAFRFRSIVARSIACLLIGTGAFGCKSMSGPGSASFASVTIKNHSSEEITRVTAEVFQADGYSVAPSSDGHMVFQKEASRMTTFAYEGLVAAQAGSITLVRVKAELVDLGSSTFRLQCQAYVVRGAGDSFFEEEQRLTNVRSGPYQSLLNKVSKALK